MTGELSPWEVRSPTIAAMLNPALISLLLSAAAYGYRRASGAGMPFEYAFLVVPMALHRGTREQLPGNTNSHITKWIADRPIVQAGFPARAWSLTPYVNEGLRYGLGVGQLSLADGGLLLGSTRRTDELLPDTELTELVQASALVGRWLSKAERPATIFALFGVTP